MNMAATLSPVSTTIPESAKERLLDAAEEVFADKGFAAASVRDICKRAGVNIAAVNYYFRDKERLYVEAVKYAHRSCTEGATLTEWPAELPALEKLRIFIGTLVHRMVQIPKPASMQLMMRELVLPTPACAEVVREYIRPMAAALMQILGDLLPAGTPAEKRWMTGFSIVGQCLFYRHTRAVARELMGATAFDVLTADQIADHVTAFTHRALGLPEGVRA